MAINAFLRADGRKGIRNTIVVGYLVECAHHVSREIVYPYRDRDVHLIGFPGCFPNPYSFKMMERLCTHPNVGAVLLGVTGSAALFWLTWGKLNAPTAIVAIGSSAVLGALVGFMCSSFAQIAGGAWWQARRGVK